MTLKSLALTLSLALATTASLAQAPQMGTWKLDESKSKVPANATKITTVVDATDGDNIKVTTDGTGRDGQPIHNEWTGKFDGKDYPVTGSPTADVRAYTKVNDRTLTVSDKKSGKQVTSGRIVVSADGKSRTVTVTGTDASGKKVSSTAVYTKQ